MLFRSCSNLEAVAKATANTFEGKAVGDAGKSGALVVFVFTLFETASYEGICGRFGRDRRLTLAYRPTRVSAR